MKKSICLLLVGFLFAMGINSCKKDSPTATPPVSGHPQIKSNVIIVDTTQWKLKSNSNQVGMGIFEFSFYQTNTSTVTVKVGDIIIGSDGEGFLRKVTSVQVTQTDMVLKTTSASLSDVFSSGNYHVDMDMNDIQPVGGSAGFSYDFTTKTLYHEGSALIKMTGGHVDMNPQWSIDFGFDTLGINSFELSAKNFVFNDSFSFTAVSPQQLVLGVQEVTFGSFSKKVIKWVKVGDVFVPVVAIISVDLTGELSTNINATKGAKGTFADNDVLSLGVRYTSGHWEDIFSNASAKTLHIDSVNGGQQVVVKMGLTPKVSVKLYGEDCTSIATGLKQSLVKKMNMNTGDWDLQAHDWLANSSNVTSTKILGNNIPLFSQNRVTDSLNLTTPAQIEVTSGNHQSGPVGQVLASPVMVRVLDSDGNGRGDVIVHFTLANGGLVSPTDIKTDAGGFAQTNWQLGAIHGTQTLTAKVLNANSQNITGSPLTLTATGQ